MKSGIYAITNVRDCKKYIGQSVNIHKRWNEHQYALEHNKHFNIHLQRAWNRGDRFEFSVIEECEEEKLNEREIYWIAYYNATDCRFGYNMCIGGGTTTGRVCSEETRRKIANSNRGRKHSADVVKKRNETFRKRMADPVYREQTRKRRSEAAKKRGDPWNKGKRSSEETRRRQSESLKGKKKPKSQGEKLRELYSGEKSITAKLKECDVVQIRLRFLSGERQCDIHRDYPQITTQTLYDIVRNRRWKSVPNTIEELEEMETCYELC